MFIEYSNNSINKKYSSVHLWLTLLCASFASSHFVAAARCGEKRKSTQLMNNAVPETKSSSSNPCAPCGETFASDRKSTRLNSSHITISYAVFCLKKKKKKRK